MLRESVTLTGESVDFDGLADPACKSLNGVPYSESLIALADTFVGRDAAAYAEARAALAEDMGERALVDAVGVASNFQRMDRIADATGIPSDPPMVLLSEDLASRLGLDKYVSAGNTPKLPLLTRLLVKLVALPKFREMVRRQSAR